MHFGKLLEMCYRWPVPCEILQYLAFEFYKTFSGICTDIMRDVSPLNLTFDYNMKKRSTFSLRPVNLGYNKTESQSYCVPEIKDLVLDDTKTLESQFQNTA